MLTRKALLTHPVAGILLVAGLAFGRTGLVGLGVSLFTLMVVGQLFAPRARLTGSLHVSQERLREEDPLDVTATLTAQRGRTGLLEVAVDLPPVAHLREGEPLELVSLAAGDEHTLSLEADVPVRGIYPIGPLKARARDPFDLYASDRNLADPRSLTVYPRWRAVKDLPIGAKTERMLTGKYAVHQPGDGTSFYGLRGYLPSDPMRSVNWKATAKSRELVVNQWERESVTDATIFVDHRAITGLGPADDNPLLHITRLAATLTSYFMGLRDSVRVVLYGARVKSHRGARGEGHFHAILQDLSALEPQGTTTLGHALDIALPHIPPRSPVIILTAGAGDPTMGDAVARLRAMENLVYLLAPRFRVGKGPGAQRLQRDQAEAVEAARSMGARTHTVGNQDEALRLLEEVFPA